MHVERVPSLTSCSAAAGSQGTRAGREVGGAARKARRLLLVRMSWAPKEVRWEGSPVCHELLE